MLEKRNCGKLLLKAVRVSALFTVFVLLVCAFCDGSPGPALGRKTADYQLRPLSPEVIAEFLAEVSEERTRFEQFLKEQNPGSPEKIARNPGMRSFDEIISAGQKLSAELGKAAATPDQMRRFIQIQRQHFNCLDAIGEAHPGRFEDYFTRIFHYFGGPLILNVPNPANPEEKLGDGPAGLEAAELYAPEGRGPIGKDELARLSPIQVSRLQPAKDHPTIVETPPGNRYDAFLEEMKTLVRLQNPKLERFDFGFSKRVLFCTELPLSPSPADFSEKITTILDRRVNFGNPKLPTFDRFGLKWQMKWGPEIHTDVALSRLYIDLGASCTDIKLYSGPGETILVLAPPSKRGPDVVHTFAQVCDRILKRGNSYHPGRFLLPEPVLKGSDGAILGTGVVDKAFAERESIGAEFIGANYVKFRECQLSFFCPAVKCLGDVPLNSGKALIDRVHRGSLVFNAWINNIDMKENNCRTAMLFNRETRAFDRFVEFQSDLGYSLGKFRCSGELNSFPKSFIENRANRISFKMRPFFLPRVWKHCTWADARWMAARISSFSRFDLERCFSESGWPSFVQKVAVERLLARRNELIKPFRLDLDGFREIPCDPDFTFETRFAGNPDVPVRNGRINGNSALVRNLESNLHPEGLARIISR